MFVHLAPSLHPHSPPPFIPLLSLFLPPHLHSLTHNHIAMSMLYKKAVPMVARAMTNTPLARSIGLMRPSFAVGMVRSYYRAHEDQSLVLPNNIDNHKPEFKVSPTMRASPCHWPMSDGLFASVFVAKVFFAPEINPFKNKTNILFVFLSTVANRKMPPGCRLLLMI